MSQPSTSKHNWKEIAIVALIAAAAVAGILLNAALKNDLFTFDKFAAAPKGDHTYYVQIATEGPGSCNEPPYCWRVLVPVVAGALPVDTETGFLAITLITFWLTGIVLYLLLRTYNLAPTLALVGMLLFYATGWAAGFLVTFFVQLETPTFLAIVLAIYCARTRRDALFMVIVALGVATKESALFALPLYYTLNATRLIDVKLAARTVLLALPALLVLFAIRWSIPPTNPNYYWEALNLYSTARMNGTIGGPLIIAPQLRGNIALSYFFDNLATFGIMLALPFLAMRRNAELLVRYSPFLLLVNVQLLIAENTERLLVYAFPAVILMSVNGLAQMAEKLQLGHKVLLLLPVGWYGVALLGKGWMRTFLEWQAVAFGLFATLLVCLAAVQAQRSQQAAVGADRESRPAQDSLKV